MGFKFRSGCPIASTLDIVGDKWSLLILRDILIHHKITFKELSQSDEGIAPSILSSRLKLLVTFNLLTKNKQENNQKENIYLLTDKSMELAMILIDLTIWGDRHLRGHNEIDDIAGLDLDRSVIIQTIKERYLLMTSELKLTQH